MSFAKAFVSVARRQLSASSKKACDSGKKAATPDKGSKGLMKLHALQKHYQRDDGKPIFLKRGLFDQILYRGTVFLCMVGLAMDMKYYFGYILKE